MDHAIELNLEHCSHASAANRRIGGQTVEVWEYQRSQFQCSVCGWQGYAPLPLGRYKQTTHHPNNSSGSVTITNPIHPLFGQTVGVRKIRRLGATVQVSLNHPDGGSFSLPANETSLGSDESLHPSSTKALLDVHQLLVLADWIAVHRKVSPDSANSGVQFEDGEVAQHPPHATPSSPARRSLRRDKRPTTTTDSSSCPFGEQNAECFDDA